MIDAHGTRSICSDTAIIDYYETAVSLFDGNNQGSAGGRGCGMAIFNSRISNEVVNHLINHHDYPHEKYPCLLYGSKSIMWPNSSSKLATYSVVYYI